MKALVETGELLGLLAYHDGRLVGWCAVAPRATYTALSRSRVLKAEVVRRLPTRPIMRILL